MVKQAERFRLRELARPSRGQRVKEKIIVSRGWLLDMVGTRKGSYLLRTCREWEKYRIRMKSSIL